eukprot:gene13244-15564_t
MSDCTYQEVVDTWNSGFSDYRFPMVMSAESLLARFASEGQSISLSVVAVDKATGEPAGIIASGVRENSDGVKYAWNGGTCVVPKYRRRGVARIMMLASIDVYRKAGVSLATLEVAKYNVKAMELYKSVGFETVSEMVFGSTEVALRPEAFGVANTDGYQFNHVAAQLVSQLPFYEGSSNWQSQWQSNRDGEGIIMKDNSGQPIAYALVKFIRDASTAKIVTMYIRQCIVAPSHLEDADKIIRVMFTHIFSPLDCSCKRMTYLASHNDVTIKIFKEASMESSLDSLWMTMKL